MSRSSMLILLGVLTILAPFSGLPIALRNLLAAIFGACVLGIGVSLRTREARPTMGSVSDEARRAAEQPPTPISSI